MSEQEFFCLCIPANLLKLDMLISRRPEVFLISSKFTGEHPCRIVISIKLLCNFIKITLRHGCSPVHLLHISRIPFPKNTFGRLLLQIQHKTVHRTVPTLIAISSNRKFQVLLKKTSWKNLFKIFGVWPCNSNHYIK